MSTAHTAPTLPPPPETGVLLAGKYRIERLIGEGGMGKVLAAHHELLDVRVAVKVLSPDLVRKGKVVQRFLREARAVARLKSEHVARVMDVGLLEDGRPFIVMELLEGRDLDQLIHDFGAFTPEQAVDCAIQALEAMAHAHAAGIVHRDLKPANLFLSRLPDGRDILKVLDFGIAKTADAHDEGPNAGGLTGERAILGSPSYMAPEQVRNARDVDGRADIWALGAILYELLTGHVAFPGTSAGEIFAAVLERSPPAIRSIRPQVSAALEATVMRCLARDRDQRPGDVAVLARALSPHGSGRWAAIVPRIEQTLLGAGARPSESSFEVQIPAPAVEVTPESVADTEQVEVEAPPRRSPPPRQPPLPAPRQPAPPAPRPSPLPVARPPAPPVTRPPAPPAARPEPPPEPDEHLSVPPPPAVSRDDDAPVVLVVDDDEAIRTMVVRAVGTKCTVYEAADGEAALALLLKIPNPDAIVCDVMMPRLDGYALGKKIKASPALRSVPILFLTAKASALDVVQAINSGARHHLAKPFKVAELLEKLGSAMGRPTLWK